MNVKACFVAIEQNDAPREKKEDGESVTIILFEKIFRETSPSFKVAP